MRTLWLIIALLIVIPVAEISVLVAVGQAIGAGWTVLLVLLTSALGGWLLKREGLRALRAFQSDTAEGRPPGRGITDGLLVLAGGLMMLVPGFVSDVIGLLMILPPTRGLFRGVAERAALKRYGPAVSSELFGPRQVRIRKDSRPGPGEAIEGEIV
ncbi:FxsA family protein [Longispora albida]|uniref:FxsA family protein n=1 Tax=Longispora albida TaxID=203523 RepID=UPI0003757282|nr:FxsA family protein [Longispora albida]